MSESPGPALAREPAGERPAGISARTYTSSLALLVVAAVGFVYWRAWLCDDAYITFRHVSNCLAGYGPVFNPGERVQGFTHPLWFLILLAGGRFFDLYGLSVVLGLASTAAIFCLLAGHLAGRRHGWGLLLIATVFLLGSHTFVEFQTSGLETPLTSLLVAFGWVWLLGKYPSRPPPVGLTAVWASLLVLTRPDHAVLCGPVLVWAVVGGLVRRDPGGLRKAASGLLPVIAWHGFATVYYGTPSPNTAYAKLALPANVAWTKGLTYLLDYAQTEPLQAGMLIVVLAAATYVALRDGRGLAGGTGLWLTLGLWLELVYVAGIGGDCMRGRLVMPVLVAGTIQALHLLMRFSATRESLPGGGWGLAAGLVLACVLTAGWFDAVEAFRAGYMMLQVAAFYAPLKAAVCILVWSAVFVGGFVGLGRGSPSRRGPRVFLVLMGLLIVYAIAVVGQWNPPLAPAVIFFAAMVAGVWLTGLRLNGSTLKSRPAQAGLVLLTAAVLSLVDIQGRTPSNDSGDIWDTYVWYRTRWSDSRFRETPEGLHPTIQDWIRVGNSAARYSEVYGPIAISGTTMGFLPYHANSRVHVIDELGLTDAFVARLPARPGSKVGHIRHDIPLAYLRLKGVVNLLPDWERRLQALDPTLRADAEALKTRLDWDEPSRQLWERVRLATAGPLFSRERLRNLPGFIRGR